MRSTSEIRIDKKDDEDCDNEVSSINKNFEGCCKCAELQRELDLQRDQSKSNFLIFKQKVISTGELISEFHRKSQELDNQKRSFNELKSKLEMCYGETGSLRIQLDKALQANEPLKKTLRRFEKEKMQLESEVQQLKNSLNDKEGEIIELKKVTFASQLTQDTLKRTKSDTEKEHERDKKKVINQAKLLDKLNKKLQELTAKRKEDIHLLKQLEKENKKMKEEKKDQKLDGKKDVKKDGKKVRKKDVKKDGKKDGKKDVKDTKKKNAEKSNLGRASRTSPRGVLSPSPSPSPSPPHSPKHVQHRAKINEPVIEKANTPTSPDITSSDGDNSTDSDSDASDNGVELQKLFQLSNELTPEIRTNFSPPLSPIPASPKSCSFSQTQKDQSDSLTSRNVSAILDRDLSLSDSDSETFESFSDINSQKENPFLVKSDDSVKKVDEIVSVNIIETITDANDDESIDFSVISVKTNTDKESNSELIRKKKKMKLKKDINNSEFISSSESESEGSSKLLKCNEKSPQFVEGCAEIKSEIKNEINANVDSNLESVSFSSLPVLNQKCVSVSKSTNQLSEYNTYSLLQDKNDQKEDVGRILSVSSCCVNEQVFEQPLSTNYTSQIESIPITSQHSAFTCVPSIQSTTTTVTTCNVEQSSLTYPNMFRPLSPPLSPIPPSPGRSLLTPIISPLPQNDYGQYPTLISNQVSSSRHTHLTPIISPLPQTPLPESVSPLPLSPTILSPPLIRGSALLQAENISTFAPKPVTQRLVADEMAMKNINSNIEQPELPCSMRIRGLECNDFGIKKRTSDLLNKIETKLIISSQKTDHIGSVYSKHSLLKQGPFAAKRSLLLNESYDPVTKTTDTKSFNQKNCTSSIRLVTKAFQATSRNVESSIIVSVDQNISNKNSNKMDLNFVDTKVPVMDKDELKTSATLTTFEKKGSLKRKPSLISPNDASLFKKPKVNEKLSTFDTSCTSIASYNQKCDQDSNTTDMITISPKLVDVSNNSYKGIQEDLSSINCSVSSNLSTNLCTQISSSVKTLEMKKEKANSIKHNNINMVRISVSNDFVESKPHKEGEVFDAEDITTCECTPVGINKDNMINPAPCSEELKYRKRDSKQTEVGYVLQLLKKFSKKSINKQRLISALSDKVNTSAASLSHAIVKHVASCEVFLLPTMLKLLQKTICTECVKSRFLNITQSCCKLCAQSVLSNMSFYETCHPISLLTTQVLTETENNLLCVLNELIKLPHLKKLFKLLTQHSRSTVLEGKGEMLSCEILAVCRWLAAICRLNNKLEDLIYFIYIIAHDRVSHINFAMLFITCYSIWPSIILRSDLVSQNEDKLVFHKVKLSPMSATFLLLAFSEAALKGDANSLKILEHLFLINLPVNNALLKELVNELFLLLCNHELSFMVRNAGTKELIMCPYAFSTAKSVALVCTHLGWEWTYNVLILSTIIEYLKQAFTGDEIHPDNVAITIRLIGFLCQFGLSCQYRNFNELSGFLAAILQRCVTKQASVSESVQIATTLTLMDMVPSQPQLISLIETWIQSPKEFPVPTYIEQSLSKINKLK